MDSSQQPVVRSPVPESPPSDHRGIEVEISDLQSHLSVDRRELSELVRRVLSVERVDRASISLALVDDAAIHVLNRRHLGHDSPTDVISFNLTATEGETLVGELIISAETACSMAQTIRVDARAELALYVIHGLLHLCGYDDLLPKDADRMRSRQEELLALERLNGGFLSSQIEEDPADMKGPGPEARL